MEIETRFTHDRGEFSCVIVWPNGVEYVKEVRRRLEESFRVLECNQFVLSREKAQRLLPLFYRKDKEALGQKLSEVGEGIGHFFRIEVLTPTHSYRWGRDSPLLVNPVLYDMKKELRREAGHKNWVHTSDDAASAFREALFFDKNFDGFLSEAEGLERHSGSWLSVGELLGVLGNHCNYVVLRGLSATGDRTRDQLHKDLDLLVSDYHLAAFITGGRATSRRKDRVQLEVRLRGSPFLLDLRHVGDGYQDECWQLNTLMKASETPDGIRLPSDEDYFYGLLYHALIHKRVIADDYRQEFLSYFGTDQREILFEVLSSFMRKRGYRVPNPKDKSVGFFRPPAKAFDLEGGSSISARRLWRRVYRICKIPFLGKPFCKALGVLRRGFLGVIGAIRGALVWTRGK